jgi:hypothetical protein
MECTKCKIDKDLCFFSKSKYTKSGYTYYCKSCSVKRVEEYRLKLPKKTKKTQREKELQKKIYAKKYREDNSNYYKTYLKEYLVKNKDVLNEKIKLRKNNDELFYFRGLLRTKIYYALKVNKWYKNSKNQELLGCDLITLKLHFESYFNDKINWENRKYWHIDHKIPLSKGRSKEELIKLCHYTNLQPLLIADNYKKGAS